MIEFIQNTTPLFVQDCTPMPWDVQHCEDPYVQHYEDPYVQDCTDPFVQE